MACVDILSQLKPVTDDPFDGWIKFEDDVDFLVQSFNQRPTTIEPSKPKKSAPLDIFSFLEQFDDEKSIEEQKNDNIHNLLDFKKVSSNISSVIFPKQPTKNKPKIPNQLSLNIIGLNTHNHFPSQQSLQIKEAQYSFDNVSTNLTPHNKVCDLVSFIRNKYKINKNIGILMIYAHTVLLNEQSTLKSYGVCNNASVFIAICEDLPKYNSFILKHDHSVDDFAKLFNLLNDEYLQFEHSQSQILNEMHRYQMSGYKCRKITDLDILTYEMDTNCIEMPCGHGMTAETLFYYTESELNSNKIFIKCPHIKPDSNNEKCNKIWYFPIVKYILEQSKVKPSQDLMKLELLSAMNTFKEYYHSSKCPDCAHNIYRHCCDDKERRMAHCPLCVNRFCWKCSKPWKGKLNDEMYCGNHECDDFEREVFKIISNCATKQIGHVSNVPSVRLCPKCSQLISHTEGCKHMKCHQCKLNFCFVCLKPMVNEEWQCGSSSAVCTSAPKQTSSDSGNIVHFSNDMLDDVFGEIEQQQINVVEEDDWGAFGDI